MSDLQTNYAGVFDGRLGFGKKPAVLVVDFMRAYTTEGSALYAPDVVTAVSETIDLLNLARQKNIPVIYTQVLYNKHGLDGGLFVQKVPVLRSMVPGESMADIVPELSPAETDVIRVKQ